YCCNQAGIEWFWNQILAAKLDLVRTISFHNNFRDRLFGELCECAHCREFHFLIYFDSPHVEGAAEYIRESKHIVYLVGMIRSSRGKNCIRSRFTSKVIIDFR